MTYCNIFKLAAANGTPGDYRRWERLRSVVVGGRRIGERVEMLSGSHPLHRTFEKFAEDHKLDEGRYLVVPCDDDTLHVAVEAELVPSTGLVCKEVK